MDGMYLHEAFKVKAEHKIEVNIAYFSKLLLVFTAFYSILKCLLSLQVTR